MSNSDTLKALFIIANAGFAQDVIDTAREAGARGATIINARGGGIHHEVFMGITVDSEKEIILCIVEDEIAQKIMEQIRERAGIHTPAHSICFSVAIDCAVGLR